MCKESIQGGNKEEIDELGVGTVRVFITVDANVQSAERGEMGFVRSLMTMSRMLQSTY